MKKIPLTIIFLSVLLTIQSQEHFVVKLWSEGAPEENGLTETPFENGCFNMVTEAELWVYLPSKEKVNGQAVILCPGGAYLGLAFDHEGTHIAKWLAERGIAGLVLKYRMPNGNPEIPKKDVFKAIEMTRQNAKKWNINPKEVGVMGSSAGGHLASMAATQFTSAESRPDFALLIYPVITMKEEFTNIISRENLIGKGYNDALVKKYSSELKVRKDTPPVFIAFSNEDAAVHPRNGTLFYDALKEKGVSAELHIYPTGIHGWGWSEDFEYVSEYRTALLRWLAQRKTKE